MRYNLHGNGVPFQQISLTLSINPTEIGTSCPKITLQTQNFLLSNLCSALCAFHSTLTLLNFPVLNFVFFWMLSIPIAYMCEPHSQLRFRCSILCFFACFLFREPRWIGHILNLDSGVEFCVFLDALNYENLHVRTTFSTWIQVLNGYVFWMLSIRRAYMCEPHSQLGFTC